MPAKDIKRLVIKQLKTKFPYWRRLTKKQKKALAKEALDEVMASIAPYWSTGWKTNQCGLFYICPCTGKL